MLISVIDILQKSPIAHHHVTEKTRFFKTVPNSFQLIAKLSPFKFDLPDKNRQFDIQPAASHYLKIFFRYIEIQSWANIDFQTNLFTRNLKSHLKQTPILSEENHPNDGKCFKGIGKREIASVRSIQNF